MGASRSVGTETMEFHEGLGLLGPCRGCVGGSLGYCCGGGCRLTCFPERRGTLTMLRDAGLNFDAKGWWVKRYHDEEAVGGKHNKAGWMDNIGGGASKGGVGRTGGAASKGAGRGRAAGARPTSSDEQPRGREGSVASHRPWSFLNVRVRPSVVFPPPPFRKGRFPGPGGEIYTRPPDGAGRARPAPSRPPRARVARPSRRFAAASLVMRFASSGS